MGWMSVRRLAGSLRGAVPTSRSVCGWCVSRRGRSRRDGSRRAGRRRYVSRGNWRGGGDDRHYCERSLTSTHARYSIPARRRASTFVGTVCQTPLVVVQQFGSFFGGLRGPTLHELGEPSATSTERTDSDRPHSGRLEAPSLVACPAIDTHNRADDEAGL